MSASAPAIATLKRACRRHMKDIVKSIGKEMVDGATVGIQRRLLSLPEVDRAQSVFVFLSMPHEVETRDLVRRWFREGKNIYIPRVLGKRAMACLHVPDEDRLDRLEPNAWGIPEPPLPRPVSREEADDPDFPWEELEGEAAWAAERSAIGVETPSEVEVPQPVDVVIMPGLGFTEDGCRIGYGRGYYGACLSPISRVTLPDSHSDDARQLSLVSPHSAQIGLCRGSKRHTVD